MNVGDYIETDRGHGVIIARDDDFMFYTIAVGRNIVMSCFLHPARTQPKIEGSAAMKHVYLKVKSRHQGKL